MSNDLKSSKSGECLTHIPHVKKHHPFEPVLAHPLELTQLLPLPQEGTSFETIGRWGFMRRPG